MLPLLLIPYILLIGLAGDQIIRYQSKSSKTYKIVGFKENVGMTMGQQIVEGHGVKVKKYLPLANACLCEVEDSATTYRSLTADSAIEFIEDDYEGWILGEPVISFDIKKAGQEIPWGVEKIGAPDVWKEADGRGVKVAVIDTGVDLEHPDLEANLAEAGWVLECQNIVDDNGHGTHVAGTIAAVDNDIGVVGVAPKATIYAVKAFNKSGRGNISNVIDALNWCVERNVQVINMSFGFKNNSKALQRAIKEAYSRNIVLVAASGNSGGSNSVLYPAKYPEVIAVGASNSNDKAAWFSSGGVEVDLIAPGAGIMSTYKDGGYESMSGTSMAAPHVTGAAALLLSAVKLTPAQVRQALTETATDLGIAKNKQGAGLLNVKKALARAKSLSLG